MAKQLNGHGRPGHNSGGSGSLWLRRSYNFIDKDPEIDRFRTLWQRHHIKEADLAVLAGLSDGTVKNMFGGQTRRPAHSTFAKMAGALGYSYELVQEHKVNYDKEIPKAREQRKSYRLTLTRKRERAQKK